MVMCFSNFLRTSTAGTLVGKGCLSCPRILAQKLDVASMVFEEKEIPVLEALKVFFVLKIQMFCKGFQFSRIWINYNHSPWKVRPFPDGPNSNQPCPIIRAAQRSRGKKSRALHFRATLTALPVFFWSSSLRPSCTGTGFKCGVKQRRWSNGFVEGVCFSAAGYPYGFEDIRLKLEEATGP